MGGGGEGPLTKRGETRGAQGGPVEPAQHERARDAPASSAHGAIGMYLRGRPDPQGTTGGGRGAGLRGSRLDRPRRHTARVTRIGPS